MTRVLKLLRFAASFVANFIAAVIGEAIFASGFLYIARTHTPAGQLYREYLLSAVLCSLIGYFVFWKWQSAPAKMVWLAGVASFAYRVVSLWTTPHSIFQSVLVDEPALAAVVRQMFEAPYIISRTGYTIVLVRTIFYSIGAWVCWSQYRFGRVSGTSSKPSAETALLEP